MENSIEIIYKKVKTINIKVKPTLKVIVTAPIGVPQRVIDELIIKRQDWILKHLNHFNKLKLEQPKDYVSGKDFMILGRHYRLKVTESKTESVMLSGGYLHLQITDKNNLARKTQLIDKWYKEKAISFFNKKIAKYKPIVNKDVNKVTVRKMKTRWGSCNPRLAYINLNLELIKKHPSAIEYVVLHELTHLLYYYHDKNFYNYISTLMPDWKIRKNRLLN